MDALDAMMPQSEWRGIDALGSQKEHFLTELAQHMELGEVPLEALSNLLKQGDDTKIPITLINIPYECSLASCVRQNISQSILPRLDQTINVLKTMYRGDQEVMLTQECLRVNGFADLSGMSWRQIVQIVASTPPFEYEREVRRLALSLLRPDLQAYQDDYALLVGLESEFKRPDGDRPWEYESRVQYDLFFAVLKDLNPSFTVYTAQGQPVTTTMETINQHWFSHDPTYIKRYVTESWELLKQLYVDGQKRLPTPAMFEGKHVIGWDNLNGDTSWFGAVQHHINTPATMLLGYATLEADLV